MRTEREIDAIVAQEVKLTCRKVLDQIHARAIACEKDDLKELQRQMMHIASLSK